MRLCQEWARINRSIIIDLLTGHLWTQGNITATPETLLPERFESVHNYIGDDNIIRKGAISAREGQKCIIPMNMRDGSLICSGKGNPDWNFSAPHGAGRIMSRAKAFEQVSLEAFAESMKGIYSETVSESPTSPIQWISSTSSSPYSTSRLRSNVRRHIARHTDTFIKVLFE